MSERITSRFTNRSSALEVFGGIDLSGTRAVGTGGAAADAGGGVTPR